MKRNLKQTWREMSSNSLGALRKTYCSNNEIKEKMIIMHLQLCVHSPDTHEDTNLSAILLSLSLSLKMSFLDCH